MGGGKHTWAMEGFLGTGHFLGLAQGWHSRQLQNKDVIVSMYNSMYAPNKQKGNGYIFTSSNPCTSSQYHVGSFTYLSFQKVPFLAQKR